MPAGSPTSRTYADIVVSPFTELLDAPSGGSLHRGGPHWPDFETRTFERHLHGGRARDDEPEAAEPVATIEEDLAWAGPIVRHFGHQLAHFSMRLRPTVADRPDITVAFASSPKYGIDSMAAAPAFVQAICDWLEVGQRVFIERPVRARSLLIHAQAEQDRGPGPSEAHLDDLDALVDRRAPDRPRPAGTLYVSRAGLDTRFAGEVMIEAALRRAGVRIMRPETRPLVEQLRTYLGAERIIFAEGSAVHGLQLLGRLESDVVVLNRRTGKRIAEDSLRPRARRLEYRDSGAHVVNGIAHERRELAGLGIPVPDEAALLEVLDELAPGIRRHWDAGAFAAARDEDVLAWIGHAIGRPRLSGPRSRARIGRSLDEAGLAHLRPAADRLMAATPVPPARG